MQIQVHFVYHDNARSLPHSIHTKEPIQFDTTMCYLCSYIYHRFKARTHHVVCEPIGNIVLGHLDQCRKFIVLCIDINLVNGRNRFLYGIQKSLICTSEFTSFIQTLFVSINPIKSPFEINLFIKSTFIGSCFACFTLLRFFGSFVVLFEASCTK